MKYYIYCLKDKTDTVMYVGQTINPNERKGCHKRKKPKHTFRVLKVIDDRIKARDTEIDLIRKYNTFVDGWNKSPGGEGFENYSRKGIGGVKRGNVPWNKGKKNCFSEETINKMSDKRKGVVHSSKVNPEIVKDIRKLYYSKPLIDSVGEIQKNGKPMSYVQAFCKKYHTHYGISINGLKKIVLKETWKDV